MHDFFLQLAGKNSGRPSEFQTPLLPLCKKEMPGGYGFLSRGDGVRSCLTPDSRPPSRIDFLRENRLRLAALQERNLEKKRKDEERRSSATQRTPKTKHASSMSVSRPRSASAAGTTDVLILSSPSNTAPTHTNDSDLSNAETPEKFSPTSRKSSSACSSIVYALFLFPSGSACETCTYICMCVRV